MNSRVPNGSAEATTGTARPTGMPLGQWLNAKIAQPAPVQPAYAPPPVQPAYVPPPAQPPQMQQMPAQPMQGPAADSLSEIHQRLDGITRQIDQMSQRRAAMTSAPTASGLANQLNDAISRLDMRLNNLSQSTLPHRPQVQSAPMQSSPVQSHPLPSPPVQSNPAPSYPTQSYPTQSPPTPGYDIDRAAAEIRQSASYHASPPLSPSGMDAAIAEITARRFALSNGGAQTPVPNPFMQYAPAPPLAPAPMPVAPSPPAPAPVDLSGIERQLSNLTSQMEALRRPDHLDQSITSFREELAEIRRSLTEALPRQAIDSLESEIRALGQKIAQSRESGADQETLTGIERALNEIYSAVRSLTPAEQLTGYDTAIQNLSSKIDLLVRANPDSNIVQQLEDAIAALRNIAANVASNDAIVHMSDHIRALGEKLDHLSQSGGSDMLSALEQRITLLTAAMEGRPVPQPADSSHLEDALHALSERIDRLSAGNDSSGAMAHVEQRIAYLLERLEGSQPSTNGLGRIEEALSDILRHLEQQRVSFASTEAAPAADTSGLVDTIRREITDVRHSQSATDRRTQDTLEALHSTLTHVVDRLAMIEGDLRRVPAAPQPQAMPAPYMPPPVVYPELPNPAAPLMSDVRMPFTPAPAAAFRDQEPPPAPAWQQPAQRVPIDPNLPPDFPLEPGARTRTGAAGTEAIAASDVGLGQAPAADGGGQTNFIAAARRAAQAAASATSEKPGRVTALTEAARSAAAKATAKVTAAGETQAKPSRIRSILVGLGVVVLVIGTFKIALTFLENADGSPAQAIEKSAAPTSLTPPPAPVPAPAPTTKAEASSPSPLLTSPTAVERNPFFAPAKAAPPPAPASPAPSRAADVTGSIAEPVAVAVSSPAPQTTVASLSPISDKIPDAVAGPMLRDAALRGDPAAAYEVAARYAEGRGTQVNYEEAIKWYERSADKGIVMAMFRLGTLLEKGLGTKKDPDTARRYYLQAAERGNAKAMHNLAVLDADGGGKGPNYKAAGNWFKKAAERGIADSQYNLGILYARGIGLEQNLAESYKWFSLAATQGDADAGRKRDDLAKRLDQQSLAAAKLAIQTFSPERQPNDAIAVAAPAGGWDAAPTAAKRPAAKPGKTASR